MKKRRASMTFLLPTRTTRAAITTVWSVTVKPRAIVGGTGMAVVVVLEMAE